jgi:HSP20 family protein
MTTEVDVKENETSQAERTRPGSVYRPHVDILESQDELTLVADVPGAKGESIDIDFEDGLLTIQGRVEPRYQSDRRFLLCEYGIGDFYRTFRVSEQIDASRIHAECVNGVLTVHLPKTEAAKPRKIEVRAGA